MKIKMAVIRGNIEKCVKAGVYGTSEGRSGLNVKRLLELEKNDVLVFYAAGICKLAGIFKVIEPVYESNTKIWDDNTYPYRVNIEPIIYLPEEKWIDIKDLINDLDYFKNKFSWSMHFIHNLLPVNEKDYHLIKSKMEQMSNL
jgi:predicted RNA-binding protein